MGYDYRFKNSEETIRDSTEFKEILLWKLIAFVQDSLPNKRPVEIKITQDGKMEKEMIDLLKLI